MRLRGRRVPVLEGALDRVELVANLLGGEAWEILIILPPRENSPGIICKNNFMVS